MQSKRRIKPYLVAVLLVILFVFEIFVLDYWLVGIYGIASTVIHEVILAAMAISVMWLFRAKMNVVFPVHKPKVLKLLGVAMMWGGAYAITMMIAVVMSFFFPTQMQSAGAGVSNLIDSLPVIVGVLVVAVTPAICEEIAFRGALLGCFREMKNRWIGLVIVSLIFGACHGSVWRMIPTGMLGFVMGYILLESNNMIYNCFFHFLNNGIPVVLITISNILSRLAGMDPLQMQGSITVPLAAVGFYTLISCVGPLLFYAGDFLLHYKEEGFHNQFIPGKDNMAGIWAIAIAGILFYSGAFVTVLGVLTGW